MVKLFALKKNIKKTGISSSYSIVFFYYHCISAGEPGAGGLWRTIQTSDPYFGGTEREYLIYIPSTYTPDNPSPLVLGIYGIYAILGFWVLRAHLLFQLWTRSLCVHCKTKQKNLRISTKNFVDFQKILKIEFWWRQFFYFVNS